MGYVKLNYKRPTAEFTDYIIYKLKEIYGEINGLKAKDVNYTAWDDSDQPGMDERVEFKMPDGRKFSAAMTHNRWSHFKEIQ
jgi:hypothetical protein